MIFRRCCSALQAELVLGLALKPETPGPKYPPVGVCSRRFERPQGREISGCDPVVRMMEFVMVVLESNLLEEAGAKGRRGLTRTRAAPRGRLNQGDPT